MFKFVSSAQNYYLCFFCLNNLHASYFIMGQFCIICLICIKKSINTIFNKSLSHIKIGHNDCYYNDYYDKFKWCLKICKYCSFYYLSLKSILTKINCSFNITITKNLRTFEYDLYLNCKINNCFYCNLYFKNYIKYKRIFFNKLEKFYIFNKKKYLDFINPEEIYFFLNKFIIGQEEAKKILSASVYNHYKRVELNNNFNFNISKSNILMIGPTGSGKTFIIKTISKLLNVPLVIIDSTNLTETGYVGDDVENIVQKLFYESGQNINKTSVGIVFIDEIDKISCKNINNNRDISGEGVQQSLLKIMEDKFIDFTIRINNKSVIVNINTENILFVCGGAFSTLNLENLKFLNVIESSIVITEKLVKYGIIPELLGRLSVIILFKKPNIENLKNLLYDSENSIIKQYNKLFIIYNVKLKILKSAFNYILHMSYLKKLGFRGIKGVLDNTVINISYKIRGLKGLVRIIVYKKQFLNFISIMLIYNV